MEDFFNRFHAITGISKYSNSEVITPLNIVKDMVDLLPADVFNPDAKFLDPAVKSGRFLAEIYRRLFDSPLLSHMNEADRKEHILKNQLFGLATSAAAAAIVRKQLYADATIAGNIVYVDRYLVQMANKNTDFKKLVQGGFEKSMKFDVVIGNPPYQHMTGGGANDNGATPLYNKFIEKFDNDSCRYLVMIIPARWYAGGRGLDEFRKNMLDRTDIKNLVDYPNAIDVFPNADIAGGVCYFLIDREYSGDCTIVNKATSGDSYQIRRLKTTGCDVLLRYKIDVDVLEKINKLNENKFIDIVNIAGVFGIEKNAEATGADTVFLYDYKSNRIVDRDCVLLNHNFIDRWKVFISEAYGERGNPPFFILGKPFIGKPGDVCSRTYITIGVSKSKEVAENVKSYIQTKFSDT